MTGRPEIIPGVDEISAALAAPVADRVIREWRQTRMLEGHAEFSGGQPLLFEDVQTERALVAVLLEGQLAPEELQELQPTDFIDPLCRAVVRVWSGAALRGQRFDDACMARALVAARYASREEVVLEALERLRRNLPPLREGSPGLLIERLRSVARLRRFFLEVRSIEVRASLLARGTGGAGLDPAHVFSQLEAALEACTRP